VTAPAAATTRGSTRIYRVGDVEAVSAGNVLNTMHKEGLQIWKRMGIAREIAADPQLQAIALDEEGKGAYRAVKMAEERMPNDAAELGTAVHAIIEWHWTGSDHAREVWQAHPDPELVLAHLEQFKDCERRHNMRPVMVEQSLFNERMEYAGTTDGIIEVDDPEHQCGKWHVYDAKSGKLYPEVGIQMAAYAHATHKIRFDPVSDSNVLDGPLENVCWEIGYACSVHADSCKLYPVRLVDAWVAFVAARDLHHWETAKGSALLDAMKPVGDLLPW
jgi:hypothetical protein